MHLKIESVLVDFVTVTGHQNELRVLKKGHFIKVPYIMAHYDCNITTVQHQISRKSPPVTRGA